MAPRRFLLDCDPGVDDALALFMAFGHRNELDLIAVTSVAGNIPLDAIVRNARRILELAGRADVPVYAGASRPIMNRLGRTSFAHGDDGLVGSALPEPTMPITPGHAALAISRIARAEGRLHICAIGPLTNLALALLIDPALPNFIDGITLMGGAAFVPGNSTPHAEFNFLVDPHAAAIVMESGIPVTMLGLDVTRQVIVTAGLVATVRAIGTPVALEAARLMEGYAETDGCLHDPTAIAWMVAPEIFTAVAAHVSVSTDGIETMGLVTAAVIPRHLDGRPTNCTVVTDVDAPAFERLFVDGIRRAGV